MTSRAAPEHLPAASEVPKIPDELCCTSETVRGVPLRHRALRIITLLSATPLNVLAILAYSPMFSCRDHNRGKRPQVLHDFPRSEASHEAINRSVGAQVDFS